MLQSPGRAPGERIPTMRRESYEKVCDATRSGVKRFVENRESHERGQILSCRGDGFDVDIYGKHEFWSKEDCEEKKDYPFNLPQ